MSDQPNYKFAENKHKHTKVNAMLYAKMLVLLREGIYTCDQLAEMTGLAYVTVLHYTRELLAHKVIFIDHWEKDAYGRDALKVYKLGDGKNKKRSRLTDRERSARYRAKKKQAEMLQVIAGNAEFVDHNNGHVGYRELP